MQPHILKLLKQVNPNLTTSTEANFIISEQPNGLSMVIVYIEDKHHGAAAVFTVNTQKLNNAILAGNSIDLSPLFTMFSMRGHSGQPTLQQKKALIELVVLHVETNQAS